ncbi:hypothetical protein M4486_03600 [Brachybacterium kimchii]|uniref:Uncharacterized protein n=1 Tax=Brachybacterium kimchii TaxID=2942909 RepID=A0ABY4N7B2_9MICO|nr:hypothetical protein [Brachybacterium kimchii]UQN30437.1 hypothetical protein M4486_03600 [Brachybacterium kimchii]
MNPFPDTERKIRTHAVPMGGFPPERSARTPRRIAAPADMHVPIDLRRREETRETINLKRMLHTSRPVAFTAKIDEYSVAVSE